MDRTRSRQLTAAARSATLSAFALVGCETLIDLGDEPALIEDDGEARHTETAPEPQSAERCPATTPEQQDFLTETTIYVSPTCADCLYEQCCDLLLECADDPECTETTSQFRYCYEGACVLGLLGQVESELTFRTTQCFVGRCGGTCAPTEQCLALGECCSTLEDSPVRDTCSLAAHSGDQERCGQIRRQSLANLCPETDAAAHSR